MMTIQNVVQEKHAIQELVNLLVLMNVLRMEYLNVQVRQLYGHAQLLSILIHA